MIYPNKNVVFLIRLNVDISHVPQLGTDNRVLMEAFFRNGDISDVRLTVSICETLRQVLSMLDFTVPSSSLDIINCKYLIEQKYNNEILRYFPKPPPTNDIPLECQIDKCEKKSHSAIPETPTKLLFNVISNFLDLVGCGLCLGVENKTVDLEVVGLTELSHSAKYERINFLPTVEEDKVSFRVTVPYAQNLLIFSIELQPSDPNCPPNVVYHSGSYNRRLESMVSLSEWDVKNPDNLLNITKEVREKYKNRFVNQLQKARPNLHMQYMKFVKENMSDDIEVFIQGNDVIFLIRLQFSSSQIVEQDGDERILLKITFRGGWRNNFSVELIPTGIWNRILNLIDLPVPRKEKFKHAIRYKFLLEQRLNEEILKLVPKSAVDTYISSPKLCFNGVKPEEFLTRHPYYLSRFLEVVSSGICLGVENVNIHIIETESSEPCYSEPGPSNASESSLSGKLALSRMGMSSHSEADKSVSYTVLLPYAETELEFRFIVQVTKPKTKPEFIFDVHTFKPALSSLPSLEKWEPYNPNSLLNIIKEIREKYKEHFVSQLQSFPPIYIEYQNVIAAATPDNIEVFVTEEKNCIFLIQLNTKTSHIPQLKDSRLLLHVLFRKGDSRAMQMRIISDDEFDCLLKSIKFSVIELHRMAAEQHRMESTTTPEQGDFPDFQNVLRFKLLIEQQLNQEILKIFPQKVESLCKN